MANLPAEIIDAIVNGDDHSEELVKQYLVTPAQWGWLATHKLSPEDVMNGRTPIGLASDITAMCDSWNQALGAEVFTPMGASEFSAMLASIQDSMDAIQPGISVNFGNGMVLPPKTPSSAVTKGAMAPGSAAASGAKGGVAAQAQATGPQSASQAPSAPVLRARPARIAPFTEERARFYWDNADKATLEAFLARHATGQLDDYHERRYFAAKFLIHGC